MHVLRPTARMKIRTIFPESFEINLCKSRLAILFRGAGTALRTWS